MSLVPSNIATSGTSPDLASSFSTSLALLASTSADLAVSTAPSSQTLHAVVPPTSYGGSAITPTSSALTSQGPDVIGLGSWEVPAPSTFTEFLNDNTLAFSDPAFDGVWNDPYGTLLLCSTGSTSLEYSDLASLPSTSVITSRTAESGTHIVPQSDQSSSYSYIWPELHFSQHGAIHDVDYGYNGHTPNQYNLVDQAPNTQSVFAPQSPRLPLPTPPETSPRHEPLSDIAVQPVSVPSPIQCDVINLQHIQSQAIVDVTCDSVTTSSSSRSKRKPMPSQRAARDNLIGNENHTLAASDGPKRKDKKHGRQSAGELDSSIPIQKTGRGKRVRDNGPGSIASKIK